MEFQSDSFKIFKQLVDIVMLNKLGLVLIYFILIDAPIPHIHIAPCRIICSEKCFLADSLNSGNKKIKKQFKRCQISQHGKCQTLQSTDIYCIHEEKTTPGTSCPYYNLERITGIHKIYQKRYQTTILFEAIDYMTTYKVQNCLLIYRKIKIENEDEVLYFVYVLKYHQDQFRNTIYYDISSNNVTHLLLQSDTSKNNQWYSTILLGYLEDQLISESNIDIIKMNVPISIEKAQASIAEISFLFIFPNLSRSFFA